LIPDGAGSWDGVHVVEAPNANDLEPRRRDVRKNMVDISVCGEKSTPVAVGTGIVLGYPVDVKEEAMSFREAGLG